MKELISKARWIASLVVILIAIVGLLPTTAFADDSEIKPVEKEHGRQGI